MGGRSPCSGKGSFRYKDVRVKVSEEESTCRVVGAGSPSLSRVRDIHGKGGGGNNGRLVSK